MLSSFSNRKITIWAICFALFFGALAPAISHARASASSAEFSWVTICSGSGNKQVKLADRDNPANALSTGAADIPKDALVVLKHCPFCSNHTASWALPPSSGLVLYKPSLSAKYTAFFDATTRSLFNWARAQPRGPPPLSLG
jgi:hypothetical protein